MAELRRIDSVLERYYENNGRRRGEYRNRHGVGHFLEYVQREELDDEYLPIQHELGHNVSPRDSAYGWLCEQFDFPIPHGVQLPRVDGAKQVLCFYVLQYCWKYNRAPTANYVREYIVPKLSPNNSANCNNASFRHTDQRPSRYTERTPSRASPPTSTSPPPKAHARTMIAVPPATQGVAAPQTASGTQTPTTPPQGTREGQEDRPSGSDFVLRRGRVRILSKRQFVPAHAPRAHLNIFTSKEVIAELLSRVAEQFPNESSLYYYTDITSALQMNDGEVSEYTLKRIAGDSDEDADPEPERVCFINYDLHLKGGGASLYGVVVPNERDKSNGNKWRWQLAAVLSAAQIYECYEVVGSVSANQGRPRRGYNNFGGRWKLTLPASSRRTPSFTRQLQQRLVIREELMRGTDWFAVQQIKSLQRATRRKLKEQRQDEPVSVRCSLSRAQWVAACTASFASSTAPLIPCVLSKNHHHWIEWVKLVALPSVGLYVGVSLKLEAGRWTVQSLLLDPGDIRNKHRLTGLRDERYVAQMAPFTVSLVELVFTDNHKQSTEKKLRDAKLQIKAQQDSIVRLKERLLREQRTLQKPYHDALSRLPGDDELALCGDDASMGVLCGDHKEDHDLALIVDAVLKDTSSASNEEVEQQQAEKQKQAQRELEAQARAQASRTYAVLPFDFSQMAQRRPLGAKGNILIDGAMVSSWLPRLPRFASEAALYYWLDLTVALQMSQGFAVQFVARGDGKFLAALLNFELAVGGQDLFGVVSTNDAGAAKDGHPFKLAALMTAEEIRTSFGFLSGDLPAHSRRNSAFRSWLRLPRCIAEHDLVRHPLNAHCLKVLAPSPSSASPLPNLQRADVCVSVEVLRRYIQNEVQKVSARAKGKRLIPILCVDKQRGDVHMEWVLLVELIAEGRSVGVAFRFNQSKDAFVAKAVYLDRDELERKHLLVGLKHNLCTKYLPRMPPFSVGVLRIVPAHASAHANAERLRHENNALRFQLQQMQQQQQQQALMAQQQFAPLNNGFAPF